MTAKIKKKPKEPEYSMDTGLEDNRTQKDKEEDQALEQLLKDKDFVRQLRVTVASPFNVYYDNVAFSLSARNLTGEFDILPGHHNFICILIPCTVAIRTTNEQIQNIDIPGGLLHVKEDIVELFLDI